MSGDFAVDDVAVDVDGNIDVGVDVDVGVNVDVGIDVEDCAPIDVSVTSGVVFFDPSQRPQVSFDVFLLEEDD